MKKISNKFLFILGSAILIIAASCNRGGNTGLLVPKDAGFVVHVDLGSLSSKLTWEEVKQTKWFTEALNKTTDSLGKILLNDPEQSGIDAKGSLLVYMKRTGNSNYIAFQGSLKDAEKFAATITKAGEGRLVVEKDGDLRFAKANEDENAVVYFNDKLFVTIVDASDVNKALPGQERSFGGSSGKYSLDSLKTIAKGTFKLKGSDLLDSDKRFAALINDKADMHYWLDGGNIYGGMATGMMSMMKISSLLEGNISVGKANFDNGKITVEQKNYYGKELSDLLKKHKAKALDGEALGHLPAGDVMVAFAMNYPPDGIRDFLKLLGVDGMANAAMGQLGVTTEDFIKAVGGSLIFALKDVTINRAPSGITMDDGQVIPYETEEPRLDFIFGSSVGDRNSFAKLIAVIKKETKKGSALPDSTGDQFKNKLEDKWFALGSSDGEITAFMKGNNQPAYADFFKGHHVGAYVDLQKIIHASITNSKDSAYKKNLELSAAFWKNVVLYSDINGGEATSKIEINLVDGSSNALKQLNGYIDQMYEAAPKKEFAGDFDIPEIAADTTAVAVPLPPSVK